MGRRSSGSPWTTSPTSRRRAAPACSGSSTRCTASGSRQRRGPAERGGLGLLVLLEWGSCGRVALVDGAPVGFVLYAPAAFLPGRRVLPDRAGLADAVQLTQVFVVPDARAAASAGC